MTRHLPDEYDDTLASLDAGELLSNRYRLVREIGRGGMGIVWLAEDTTLDDRQVAVKLLPTVLSRNERAIARLKREAATNLDLTHPHIVRLLNFEQDPTHDRLAYLVMQYVDGRTLDSLLVDHPDGLPAAQVLKWAGQIAEALDYAHRQAVLHRDVKPSNIMIDGNGVAFLADFGIAREAKDTMTRISGRDSSGTLPYMSPQQVDGKNDKLNDVYSLAATLYEALNGEPPFTTGDLINQIKHIPVTPIQGQSDAVNDGLLAALAKQPGQRPESARNLVSRLNRRPSPPAEQTQPRVSQAAPAPPQARPVKAVPTPAPAAQTTAPARPVKAESGRPLAMFVILVLLFGIPAIGIVGWQSGWWFKQTPRRQNEVPSRPQDVRSSHEQSLPNEKSEPVSTRDRSAPPDVDHSSSLAQHGDTKTISLGNNVSLEIVYIGPGNFMMGSPAGEANRDDDEGPQHRVTFASGFWLGQTKVTQGQYQAVTGNNPSSFKNGSNYPVETVSWNDAREFCDSLTTLARRNGSIGPNDRFRLPSEAEWEYACRAGTTTPFSTGSTISTAQANYDGTYGSGRKGVYRKKTTSVKTFAPNPWGLYDMHGNVWEWCADVYHGSYSGAPTDGSAWTTGGDQDYRVLRGGCWFGAPWDLRSAGRLGYAPDNRNHNIGFRLALDSS